MKRHTKWQCLRLGSAEFSLWCFSMSDLSNRLRDRASELSDVGFFATAHEMRQAADLIDQQVAEIAELTELVEAQKQEILELHDIRDQRDEWRRRAERLLVLATKHCNKYHHDWREITEAAQWFEE